MTKVAVISATRVSLAPVEQTAARHYPDVEIIHYLDNPCPSWQRKAGRITPNLCRMAGNCTAQMNMAPTGYCFPAQSFRLFRYAAKPGFLWLRRHGGI